MSDEATGHPRRGPKGGAVVAGRYRVDRLVARGGMSAVYLAHHVKLNRPVALKVLSPPPDAEDGSAFEERFRLEAETLASLDHPNIVILHDFGDLDDGRFFLAMEYIDGPRLSDVLRDGPLPCERALGLILQVCGGLRYAHKRGVVHRDLKPSNLLIKRRDDASELVKVVDFGLVKLTESDQSITRAGLILGSPHCMAPEQVRGLEIDHRADIYAVGVLLFRTLTGQYPFHGPNSAATMIAHLNQPIPTFFSVAPELVVPEGLEEIVRRCLAKAPADRFPDMKTLMDDLAGCLDVPPEQFRSVSQSQSTIRSQGLPAPLGSGAGRWLAFAALAAVVLVGSALGVGVVAAALLEEPAPVALPATLERAPPLEPLGPDPGAADQEPQAVAAPEPEAEPAVVAPMPVPEPEPPPAEPVAAPEPSPAPKPTPAPAAEAPQKSPPEGYMGLPDDLSE